MYEWSLVGITAEQANEQVSRMLCKGCVDLSEWEEILNPSNSKGLKPKPNKRNGSMDRRQAFGKLFKR